MKGGTIFLYEGCLSHFLSGPLWHRGKIFPDCQLHGVFKLTRLDQIEGHAEFMQKQIQCKNYLLPM